MSARHLRWVALPILGWLLILGVWQATVTVNQLPTVVLPPPAAVAEGLVGLVQNDRFWDHVSTSLAEFLTGFAIGSVLGIVAGLLLGEFATLRMATHPIVETFRFVVPFAWIPLTVLWFGTSMWGKTWLVAYAVFFVLVVSTVDAVRALDPTLSRVGVMLGMSRARRLIGIQLRAAAPSIASASRAAAAIGWIAVVAAEYVGSSSGLGFMIIDAKTSLNTEVVIAGMVVIGLVGAVLSAGISWLARARLSYS